MEFSICVSACMCLRTKRPNELSLITDSSVLHVVRLLKSPPGQAVQPVQEQANCFYFHSRENHNKNVLDVQRVVSAWNPTPKNDWTTESASIRLFALTFRHHWSIAARVCCGLRKSILKSPFESLSIHNLIQFHKPKSQPFEIGMARKLLSTVICLVHCFWWTYGWRNVYGTAFLFSLGKVKNRKSLTFLRNSSWRLRIDVRNLWDLMWAMKRTATHLHIFFS